jgi:5-enolpyruvylshikimate-3-phosphate synthase
MLRDFGMDTLRQAGSLVVRHGTALVPARVDAREQPELAMTAVVLGLAAEGETVVEQGAEAIELAHPGFVRMLQELGAEIEIT